MSKVLEEKSLKLLTLFSCLVLSSPCMGQQEQNSTCRLLEVVESNTSDSVLMQNKENESCTLADHALDQPALLQWRHFAPNDHAGFAFAQCSDELDFSISPASTWGIEEAYQQRIHFSVNNILQMHFCVNERSHCC